MLLGDGLPARVRLPNRPEEAAVGITLQLDTAAWRAHLDAFAAAAPGLVPVAKGNGYGYGLTRLAAEAERLGADTMAVGLAGEVAVARQAGFSGDIVILQPWRPGDTISDDRRVIRVISRLGDAPALAAACADRPPVLIELATPMKRFGLSLADIPAAGEIFEACEVRGWTLHPPFPRPGHDQTAWLNSLAAPARAWRDAPLWVSHATPAQAAALGAGTRLRVGTALWLGAITSRRMTATVLDIHPVARGERVGYHQRPMPRAGSIVVMAGGTAQGVGLESPASHRSLRAGGWRSRARSLAAGAAGAQGWALSPFIIAGAKRWFAEPPHMQTSLVFLPHNITPPAVGTAVPVDLSMTTVLFDEIIDV